MDKEETVEASTESSSSITNIPTVYTRALEACDKAKESLPDKPGRFSHFGKDAPKEDPSIKSNDPAYFAKSSCNSCYGRGIVGMVTITLAGNNKFTIQAICSCTKNRYARWRDNFIKDYIKNNQ